jgi:hypothetical protein
MTPIRLVDTYQGCEESFEGNLRQKMEPVNPLKTLTTVDKYTRSHIPKYCNLNIRRCENYVVACRLVARHRPRNKRDKQPLLGNHQDAI